MAASGLKKYRAAIKSNFPDFPLTKLSYLAEGWDSVAFLVNGEWVFRFPKRDEVAAQLLQAEIPLTTALAQPLPLPIPRFELVASNPKKVRPFAAYKLLPGEPLDHYVPEIWQQTWWQQPVAEFLAALHSFPLATASSLGAKPFRLAHIASPISFSTSAADLVSAWQQSLLDFYTEFQYEIYPLLSLNEQNAIYSQYYTFVENPRFFEFIPTLIHGDFSTEHVLLDVEQQRVTGIIDFGQIALGDPVYDLWREFLPFYCQLNPTIATDATLEERYSFYKKLAPLDVLLFGKQTSDFALTEYGRYELQRLWLDS